MPTLPVSLAELQVAAASSNSTMRRGAGGAAPLPLPPHHVTSISTNYEGDYLCVAYPQGFSVFSVPAFVRKVEVHFAREDRLYCTPMGMAIAPRPFVPSSAQSAGNESDYILNAEPTQQQQQQQPPVAVAAGTLAPEPAAGEGGDASTPPPSGRAIPIPTSARGSSTATGESTASTSSQFRFTQVQLLHRYHLVGVVGSTPAAHHQSATLSDSSDGPIPVSAFFTSSRLVVWDLREKAAVHVVDLGRQCPVIRAFSWFEDMSVAASAASLLPLWRGAQHQQNSSSSSQPPPLRTHSQAPPAAVPGYDDEAANARWRTAGTTTTAALPPQHEEDEKDGYLSSPFDSTSFVEISSHFWVGEATAAATSTTGGGPAVGIPPLRLSTLGSTATSGEQLRVVATTSTEAAGVPVVRVRMLVETSRGCYYFVLGTAIPSECCTECVRPNLPPPCVGRLQTYLCAELPPAFREVPVAIPTQSRSIGVVPHCAPGEWDPSRAVCVPIFRPCRLLDPLTTTRGGGGSTTTTTNTTVSSSSSSGVLAVVVGATQAGSLRVEYIDDCSPVPATMHLQAHERPIGCFGLSENISELSASSIRCGHQVTTTSSSSAPRVDYGHCVPSHAAAAYVLASVSRSANSIHLDVIWFDTSNARRKTATTTTATGMPPQPPPPPTIKSRSLKQLRRAYRNDKTESALGLFASDSICDLQFSEDCSLLVCCSTCGVIQLFRVFNTVTPTTSTAASAAARGGSSTERQTASGSANVPVRASVGTAMSATNELSSERFGADGGRTRSSSSTTTGAARGGASGLEASEQGEWDDTAEGEMEPTEPMDQLPMDPTPHSAVRGDTEMSSNVEEPAEVAPAQTSWTALLSSVASGLTTAAASVVGGVSAGVQALTQAFDHEKELLSIKVPSFQEQVGNRCFGGGSNGTTTTTASGIGASGSGGGRALCSSVPLTARIGTPTPMVRRLTTTERAVKRAQAVGSGSRTDSSQGSDDSQGVGVGGATYDERQLTVILGNGTILRYTLCIPYNPSESATAEELQRRASP